MGLSDRGLIRVGMRADLIVFNYHELQDTATFERPIAALIGIDDIVYGVPAIASGKLTGERSNRVLRQPCCGTTTSN